MKRFKNYFISNMAFHPPDNSSYTFNPATMKYLFERDLRNILIYFQPVPNSNVSLDTLHEDNTPVILFSHGNAEDVGAYFQYCRWLANKTKCHVLTYDFYNYGLSSAGPSTEDSLLECANTVFEYLLKMRKQIFIVGKSIGTVPSIYLAAQTKDKNILGLILISPLASGVRCLSISHFFSQSMLNSLDGVFGDSLSRIQHVTCPVLFFHGLQDTVVPSSNTDALYAALVSTLSTQEHTLPKFFGTKKQPGTHDNLETTFEKDVVKELYNFITHHQPKTHQPKTN